jgi:glycosyltransferase involved in cell wall biosynthesis
LSFVLPFLLTKSNKKKKSILYLAAFFPENAGYHWRVSKWREELEKKGYKVDVFSALNETEFKTLLAQNHFKFLITFIRRRFWQIVHSRNYETVIVRREILLFNDYGNLFLEKLLHKYHPKAILDFDDDIAAAKEQPKIITNWYGKLMKENGNKFNETLRLYSYFMVASDYLKKKVLSENKNIESNNICVIPTCVDYNIYKPKEYPKNQNNITFGWIGGDHNYHLLEPIWPILNKLSKQFTFSFIVIGGSPITVETKFPLHFIKWSLHTEVENLKKIDIGIMPLTDDLESKGKGGFKLLQYMGLGIVSIASPITINLDIIENENNALFAQNNQEWEEKFKLILSNQISLDKISANARRRIESEFTFQSNHRKYLEFINYVRNSGNLV